MSKYIVQHRRGTASQWASNGEIIPRAGELVIEIDEENSLHKLKIGDGEHKYSELAYLMAGDEIVTQVLAETKPRIVTVELTTNWTHIEGDKYKQDIEFDNITKYSRLDLQPDANMLAEFKQLGLVFVTENNGGVITIYSVGNTPLKAYTMQATIIETECDGQDAPVIGIPIGTPTPQSDWNQIDDTKADFIKNKPIVNGEGSNSIVQGVTTSNWNPDNSEPNQTIVEYVTNENVNENGLKIQTDNGNIIAGAFGSGSAAFGTKSQALGGKSFAEGSKTVAFANNAHAEGNGTFAVGQHSHSEGSGTTAKGNSSHAEGRDTFAENDNAHAEGYRTSAGGMNSHAEGYYTIAQGRNSHAEGFGAIAQNDDSHAEGLYTITGGGAQHVQGKWNEVMGGNYAHVVGNGDSDTKRSNAHTLDWNGNAWFAGDVSVGANSDKLITKQEVETKINSLINGAPGTLDTLNEIATALGNDPNFATTIINMLSEKVNSSELSKVATSGNYNDLDDVPVKNFTGSVSSLDDMLEGGYFYSDFNQPYNGGTYVFTMADEEFNEELMIKDRIYTQVIIDKDGIKKRRRINSDDPNKSHDWKYVPLHDDTVTKADLDAAIGDALEGEY